MTERERHRGAFKKSVRRYSGSRNEQGETRFKEKGKEEKGECKKQNRGRKEKNTIAVYKKHKARNQCMSQEVKQDRSVIHHQENDDDDQDQIDGIEGSMG